MPRFPSLRSASAALDRRRDALALLAVLLLATALRIHAIARGDVWIDEANAILIARRSWSAIVSTLALDSSPPAFYFLLHVWMRWFGDGAVALRMLSVGFGVLLTASVYRVGSQWISRPVGLWAAFLMAISPVQVFYSQQVRMYSLLPLLALWSVWWLVRYLESGAPRHLLGCLAAALAALFTHNFALHLLPVLALCVAASGLLLRRWWVWLLSAIALGAAYAAWLPTLLLQLANADHYAWFVPLWNKSGPLGVLWETLQSFSPAGEFVMFEYAPTTDWKGWPAALGAALAVWGLWQLLRRRGALGALGWSWAPLALVVPTASAVALSGFLTPHYVPGRVDQMLFPFFALISGVGIAALRPAALRSGLGVVLLGIAVAAKTTFYSDYRRLGYEGSDRQMAEVIRAHLRPGDVILCTSLTRAPLEYYLRDLDAVMLSFPRDTARHLGAQNDWRLLDEREWLQKEASVVLAEARALAGPQGRLFLARARSGVIAVGFGRVQSVNDALAPGPLRLNFGVTELADFGRFAQTGTKDVVRLSLNRLQLTPLGAAEASR